MRPPMRSLDAVLPGAILFAGLGFIAGGRLLAAKAMPQSSQMPAPPTTMPGSARPGAGTQGEDENNNPMMRQLAEQQANKRNDMRQRLIVDDTTKLVNLAQQVKEEADKGSMAKSSATLARKVEEIEKLAKAVKDKMREGQ